MDKRNRRQKGVALYLTVVISSLILLLALNIASLFFTQTKIVSGMGYSVSAFYAAETGIERALWEMSQGSLATHWTDTLSNGATYETDKYDKTDPNCPVGIDNYCLKSTGYHKSTKRAIRISR